ncbi:unnamed protein product [Dovyalis caffra]|uniref:Uncharacterized protein n=1 Tax=Dovyalis caffra TaxID=77055 RepID=A0AAV1RK03_9ROSI|nr:unnamed protein product [Dovyalis caffra]
MASVQCIKPDEKTSNQEQEQMIHMQTEKTLSHEKVVSVNQCKGQTNGQNSQSHVGQAKNPAPVAMPCHEKNEKKMKDKKEKDKNKKENKDKNKKEKKEKKDKKDKKEKKFDDKKKEKSGDKKKKKKLDSSSDSD